MSVSIDELNQSYQDPIREELVQTACKFLQNPNVDKTPLAQKQTFLQRKGLTDKEIQLACERSGAYASHEALQRVPPPIQTSIPMPYHPPGYHMHMTVFDRIREVVHNMAIFSIVAYAMYKFYEKFIKPFLFGSKKKSIVDTVDDLNKSMTSSVNELKESIATVKVEVDKISQGSESSTQRQLQNLQSEISTVKGLLLSRKQFPSVSNNPVVPPSIPAWQLSSVATEGEADADPKSEELLEIGSGSGSSEPEHATKNSDSSLEIIS